jgi:hypothetical protein
MYNDGAHVELCRDHAMSMGCLAPIDVAASSAAPAAALSPGAWFWRVAGRYAGVTGTAYSPTWQFVVGHHSAPVDTSWGSVPDFNNDGYADALVSDMYSTRFFPGGTGGLAAASTQTLARPGTTGSAGDVNGDGYPDALVDDFIYYGSSTGLTDGTARIMLGNNNGTAAGDLNGDGYADVISGTPSASTNLGQIYIYMGGPGGLTTSPQTTITATLTGCQLGNSVASVGDANGDGYGDVIVGYHYCSTTAILYGSQAGLNPTIHNFPRSYFGSVVAGGGDVNGDGYADALIYGTPGSTGHVWLIKGSPSGITTTGGVTFADPATNLFYGGSFASAGDVNGDGFGDVIIGAHNGAGVAYVYDGTSGVMSTMPSTTLPPPASAGGFGAAVAGAGDVNNDGYGDVLVGAPGTPTRGEAYAFAGGMMGLSTSPLPMWTGPGANGSGFGGAVASIERTPPLADLVCRERARPRRDHG